MLRAASAAEIQRTSPVIPPRPSPSPPGTLTAPLNGAANGNGNHSTNSQPASISAPPNRPPPPLRSLNRVQLTTSEGGNDGKDRPVVARVNSAREATTSGGGTLPKTNSFRGQAPPIQNGSLRPGNSPVPDSPSGERNSGGADGPVGDDILDFGGIESADSQSGPITTDFQSTRKLNDDPRRANAVLEILKTEETYINNVEQMIKVIISFYKKKC